MTDRSIWELVSAHVPPQGPGLLAGGWDIAGRHGEVSPAAPGAADGLRLLLGNVTPDDTAAAEIALLLQAALTSRKPRPYEAMCERVAGSDVLTYLDAVLDRVPTFRVAPERIYDLGRRLVTTSRSRSVVKLGLSLFGFFEAGYHLDVVLALGRHDELTYYAARAVASGLDDPEPKLWELARNATGWGRIAAVRQLAPKAQTADVQRWLLVDGFRNDVADAYLALPAAAGGHLARRLAASGLDDGLLDGVVDLVRALLEGGPLGGMDDYPDGARATVLLVNQLRTRAETLRDALALDEIDRYVRRDVDWSRLAKLGWTPEVRQSLSGQCDEVLSWPTWGEAVEEGLLSDEPDVADEAAAVAGALGISMLPLLRRRLEAQPLDPGLWRAAMASAEGDDDVGELLDLARARLPLGTIAAGPASELGRDPEHAAHASLDAVLSALAAWPGRGWAVVAAGLSSPVVRNRNLALRVLHGWGRAAWPPEAEAALREAADTEPEPEVRRRIDRLLAGAPVEEPVARPG